MQTHAIVELEEGTLTATVGVREGGTARITASARLPLLEPTREALADALRSLASGALQGVAGAHVVLGDRRMQHFVSTVPRMAPAEVADFVVREALRVTGMPSAQEALAAVRLLQRLPGGRLAVGVTAIARNVWGPLREAFEQVHLEVLGL
ncbi:MAG: hypothetical protein FJ265_20585, partial [Planctomycetes bacterium]|nr:hypothetical protein [Planctomycetota bacterium]